MEATKVLILYYSSYGHVAAMARAAAEGAAEVTDQVHIKRVPETVPEEVATESGFNPVLQHQIAEPAELADYDAILVGTPTHYGNMSAQVSEFWARTIGLWKTGALIGKVGGGFSCSATQHGGNEATLLSLHKTMMHHGMIVVGLPYTFRGQTGTDRVAGGSPYGATTIAADDMSRQPSVTDLDGAKFQGRHMAAIAARLKAARA